MEDISQGLESRPIPCEPSGNLQHDPFPDTFQYVTRNIPGPGCARDLFEEQLCGCECQHTCQQNTCSCLTRFGPNYHPQTGQLTSDAVSSSILKPVLECNSQCGCDAGCSNRIVQHGPRVKLKVASTASKGFGLFACEDIEKLTFVCEYAGEVVEHLEAEKRMKRKEGDMNYLIVLREHCHTGVVLTCVDPEHVGNVGRFANHSCDPSLLMVPVRVDNSVPKLALFARRNICAGEELTFDYSGESVLPDISASDIHPSAVQNVSRCESTAVTGNKKETLVKNVTSTSENKSIQYNLTDGNCCKNEGVDCHMKNSNTSETTGFETLGEDRNSVENDHKYEDNVTSIPNKRKRKRMHSQDVGNTDIERVSYDRELQEKHSVDVLENSDSGRVFYDRESQAEHLADSESGKRETFLKRCLCGTARCKGYLPFDTDIFQSV